MLPDILRTERLVLRPWVFADVDDVFGYAQDPEMRRYLPLPEPYRRGDAESFIATQVLQDRRLHPSWAIEHKGRAVGGINLRFLDENRIGEMGYSIARARWGGGFATEAATAVLDAAFTSCPSLIRIRAMADARNAASLRVLEKIGMRREGVIRANRFLRGEPIDEAWCGVLREEWAFR